MAVLTLRSTQEPVSGGVYDPRLYAFDQIAKVRYARGSITVGAAAGDIGSTIDLLRIPQGRVRVIPHLSKIWCSAFGAARTLDLGFRAYYGSDGKTAVAEAGTQLAAAIDVSGALAASIINTTEKIDFFSQASVDEKTKGPILFGTVAGGTIPAAATLAVWLAYMQN